MCRPPRRPSIEAPCSPPITTAFANSGSVCSGIIALLLLQPRYDSSEALENQSAFVILQNCDRRFLLRKTPAKCFG